MQWANGEGVMTQFTEDHAARMERVARAMEGLSVGDGFGEQFFGAENYVSVLIRMREIPSGPWHYTDDTVMALGITEVLEQCGQVDQDELARVFARRYVADRRRGYGGMAHEILQAIANGTSWKIMTHRVFDGSGSMGNGGAMRAAPVGAYFAQDEEARIVEQARRSAEVTHGHPEGQAGAIAVALATAWAHRNGAGGGERMIEYVCQHMEAGITREGIERAASMLAVDTQTAARRLGNGSRVTAPDTVPFCLWCAASHLDDYVEAMWEAVSVYGDMDTNCAIVGGIVGMVSSPPEEWIGLRERLA